jgi:hypothetical protein
MILHTKYPLYRGGFLRIWISRWASMTSGYGSNSWLVTDSSLKTTIPFAMMLTYLMPGEWNLCIYPRTAMRVKISLEDTLKKNSRFISLTVDIRFQFTIIRRFKRQIPGYRRSFSKLLTNKFQIKVEEVNKESSSKCQESWHFPVSRSLCSI